MPTFAPLMLTVAIAAIGLSLAWILARGIGRAAEVRREVDRLRVSERRTSRIVETAHDAVVSTDSAGRITGWNASAERMFGWTREEALGRDGPETLFPGGLSDGNAGELATVQRALETVARHRDGRDLPVEVSLAMVRESDGWVFNAFIRDISERHEAQARLGAAQHEVLRRLAPLHPPRLARVRKFLSPHAFEPAWKLLHPVWTSASTERPAGR